jgi:hypothetical protein
MLNQVPMKFPLSLLVISVFALAPFSAHAENSLAAQRAMVVAIYNSDTVRINLLLQEGFDAREDLLNGSRNALGVSLLQREKMGSYVTLIEAEAEVFDSDLSEAVFRGGERHALAAMAMRDDWRQRDLVEAVALAFHPLGDKAAKVILESLYQEAIGGEELDINFKRRPPDMIVVEALMIKGAPRHHPAYLERAVKQNDPALIERFVYGSNFSITNGKALSHALRRDDRKLAEHLLDRKAPIIAVESPSSHRKHYPDPDYILQKLLQHQLLHLDPRHRNLEKYRNTNPPPIKGQVTGKFNQSPINFDLSFGTAPHFGNLVHLKSLVFSLLGATVTTPDRKYSLVWSTPQGAQYTITVDLPQRESPTTDDPYPLEYYQFDLENTTALVGDINNFRDVPWQVKQNGVILGKLERGDRMKINLAKGSAQVIATFADGWDKVAITELSLSYPIKRHKVLKKKFDSTDRLNRYLALSNIRFRNQLPVGSISELERLNNKTTIHLFSEQLYELGTTHILEAQLGEIARSLSGKNIVNGHLLNLLIRYQELGEYTIPDILDLSDEAPPAFRELIQQLGDQGSDISAAIAELREAALSDYEKLILRFQMLLLERGQYINPGEDLNALARRIVDGISGVNADTLHKHLAANPLLHYIPPDALDGQGERLDAYLKNKE